MSSSSSFIIDFGCIFQFIKSSQTLFRVIIFKQSGFPRHKNLPDWTHSKVGYWDVDVSTCTRTYWFQWWLWWIIRLFLLKSRSSNQVYALLKWSHWCNMLVGRYSMHGVRSGIHHYFCLWSTIIQGSIEELTLVWVSLLIRPTFHYGEVFPPIFD